MRYYVTILVYGMIDSHSLLRILLHHYKLVIIRMCCYLRLLTISNSQWLNGNKAKKKKNYKHNYKHDSTFLLGN